MSDKQFSNAERYAIYTAHGEKCYLCANPIDMNSFEVDHILPESLMKKQSDLEAACQKLGLETTFDLNDFANWMPACTPCNRKKSNTIFAPSLLIQITLQSAKSKANYARELSEKIVAKNVLSRSINTIRRAYEQGNIEAIDLAEALPFLQFHEASRTVELNRKPISLSPEFKVQEENGAYVWVKGPYGVAQEVTSTPYYAGARCSCGRAAWNGNRCVFCNQIRDE